MQSGILIGPGQPCARCGGVYGQHSPTCSSRPPDRVECLRELLNAVAAFEASYPGSACASVVSNHDARYLIREIDRLKRGDFTPEEFQALCHHRDERPGCTREAFEAGCREYQRKLFGG